MHFCIPEETGESMETESVTYTQPCWTADYTSDDQNPKKKALDNEIAPTNGYWEPNKFSVSCAVT